MILSRAADLSLSNHDGDDDSHNIAKALETIATGLLSLAFESVTRAETHGPPEPDHAAPSASHIGGRHRAHEMRGLIDGRHRPVAPGLAATIAITIEVSASAISAWPQTTPPCRHSRSEKAMRRGRARLASRLRTRGRFHGRCFRSTVRDPEPRARNTSASTRRASSMLNSLESPETLET